MYDVSDRAASGRVVEELGGFRPKENVLPAAARRENGDCEWGTAGKGALYGSLESVRGSSSGVTSFGDGSVDEELKRAEEEELSYSPPLETELWVPPLPLGLLVK